MLFARLLFENENHYRFPRVCIQKNPLIEDWDYRKVSKKKGVLHVGVLLRYRCVCLGTILALIHPYIKEDFDTLITHIQSLFS